MSRTAVVLVCAGALMGADLTAQTIPEGSQASRIELGYLRSPHFRVDPFRHVFIPHWGLVLSVGGSAQNNALNLQDVRALLYLKSEDSLLTSDFLNALGLIPPGTGLALDGQGQLGVYIGGPLGWRFSFGFTVQARAYTGMSVDDDFAMLLRDGNEARQDFTIGDSRVDALATSEYGGHMLIRTGPMGSVDGALLTFGIGGRYVIPHFYGRGASSIANGGTIRVSGQSVSANVGLEKAVAIPGNIGGWGEAKFGDMISRKGRGFAADFLVRAVWPTSGFSFEAMVANIGKLTIWNVERSDWSVNVQTTNLEEVLDSLDVYPDSTSFELREFEVRDTVDLEVTLPRIIRFTASSWANRILQLDVSTTLPVTGDFAAPLTVDLGSTWRFSRTLPIRFGLLYSVKQGLGYTGGVAVEGRNFLMRLAAGSLGGFAKDATGLAARLEWGFFF